MNDIDDSSGNRKHLIFSLKICVLLVGVPLLLAFARREGLISKDTVERGFGIMTGLVFAAYGNSIPKLNGKSPGSIVEAKVAQGLRRITGWALTIAFLVSAMLWAFAPRDVAQIGSIISIGSGALIVVAFATWRHIRCRNARSRIASSTNN